MVTFLNEQKIAESRIRARRFRCIFLGLVLFALILFIILCLVTRTGNARTMLVAAWISMILLGWGIIAFRMFAAEPAQAEERHLAGLAEVEPEIREGRFFLSGDTFRIPKSVRVRKVRLETGEETLSLNLNERLRQQMPADGSLVRVQTARKFITGLEVLEEGTEKTVRRDVPRGKTAVRALGRIFPAAVLWAMMVLILTGFIFNRMTDTDPKHKIVIYADCEVRNAAELAEKLEEGMGGAVRMVKIHPFSYALFGTEQLKSADLYLVPDSRLEEYREWFAALPGTPEEGTPVYDPESGLVTAGAWLCYAQEGQEPEPYRLYFGNASPHREDGLAARAAELLLELREITKEENP